MDLGMITTVIFLATVIPLVILYIVYRRIFGILKIPNMDKVFAGTESGKARRRIREKKLADSGKKKIMGNLGDVIPGAGQIIKLMKSLGLTNNEILALATDPAFMKGILVIMNTVGGGISTVMNALQKRNKDKGVSNRGYSYS